MELPLQVVGEATGLFEVPQPGTQSVLRESVNRLNDRLEVVANVERDRYGVSPLTRFAAR